MQNLVIRELCKTEIPAALSLAWDVFQEYEAPDYAPDGLEEFYRSIHDPEFYGKLCFFGAFVQEEMAGMIAARNEFGHIALLFVKSRYHRQGVGRRLVDAVRERNRSGKITVNSSPFGVPVYHRLGFTDTGPEQISEGIRFTPMEWKLTIEKK